MNYFDRNCFDRKNVPLTIDWNEVGTSKNVSISGYQLTVTEEGKLNILFFHPTNHTFLVILRRKGC